MAFISRFSAIAIALWASTIASASSRTCKIEKNVEYPLVFANGMPALYAYAEDGVLKKHGHNLRMGIDTGASTLVTPETASRVQASRDPYRRTRAVGTTGTMLVDHVQLRNLQFAGKLYGRLSVPKIPLPPPLPSASNSRSASDTLDGLIGSDLLSAYDVDLDLAGKSITFYEVRGCAQVTPPWTEPYTSVAIRITPRHAIVVPVEVDGYKLPAILDTGSSGFAITRRGALKSGITQAMLAADPILDASGIGGIKKHPAHKFNTLAIGGETIRDTSLQVMDAELLDGDVLIGQSYLIYRRVWISYSTGMLFIRAPQTPSAQAPAIVVQPTPLLPTLRGYGDPCRIEVLAGCTQLPVSATPSPVGAR